MQKPKSVFKLSNIIAQTLLFYCFVFPPATLPAQSKTEDYETAFFEKIYLISSNLSDDSAQKIESLLDELKSLPIPTEANDKILLRLLIEADRTADADLLKANFYWKAAELIAIRNNDYSALITSIYYHANTLVALNDYQSALYQYRRASEVFKDKLVGTDQDKSLICEIYVAGGQTAHYLEAGETARDFFEKGWLTLNSIRDWRKSLHHLKLARSLFVGRGNAARQAGDYISALADFSQALSLTENDPFRKAEVLWESGKLKREIGESAAGAADFSAAIKLLDQPTHPKTDEDEERISLQANIYNSLGLLMLEQRFSKGAVQNLNQALNLARASQDLRLEGTILRNLSIAARQKSDYQTARTKALSALKIAVQTDFTDLNISANGILASLAQTAGDHNEAVTHLRKSVVLAEKSRNALRVVESQWRLAESLFALQKYEEAKNLARESLSAAQKNQWSNLVYLSATLLGRVLVNEEKPSAAEEMFELAIREIEQKRRLVAGSDIEKVSFMRDKATAYHELLKLRVKDGDAIRAFDLAEKLKSRVLEDKVGGRKKIEAKLNSLSIKVPAATAVVSYTVTDEECFAFVFRPHATQPKIFAIAQGEKTLTEKIKRFRAGLLKFDPSFKPQAVELYTLLLKDLESEIGNAKNLIIIPDGALWELPFQALITSEQKYLIERYTVSYAPSLSVLNYLKSPPSPDRQNQFLAFANALPSAPLPETEKEVDAVSKHYGKASVFKRFAATEMRFKELAPQSSQIHLAVHGEINSTDPFNSALLLAPTTKEDGRLTVSEILKINLSANLVVLSSCDTSNGQVVNGEGLLSLSWAFLASGANNIVASQWAVEEKATANLMLDFYRILNKNSRSPATALQASQLEALKLPAPYNHPFYWSAFVVVGNSH